MKRICRLLLLPFVFLLLSWGRLGHRTIGLIAERHLSQKAKQGVQDLLGTATLADVSTWADEVRSQDAYKQTGPWHYINLPFGLSREAFDQAIYGMTARNVYDALSTQEQTLFNPSAPRDVKIEALKFIVHLIGDLHQPMHVSREEDQGGNKIQVNYEGKGTNLHALWDSRLLEHEGLTDQALAAKVDTVSAARVKQLQGDPLLDWLWESYGVSTQLYGEVEAMSNRTITDAYYQAHIGIAEARLEKAGVRLAGVLNMIFEGGSVDGRIIPPPPAMAEENAPAAKSEAATVELKDVGRYIGKEVKVCGQVFGDRAFSGLTLVNLGSAYPNQLLTVVLKEEAKHAWKSKDGKTICVQGKVTEYKGKPQIEISMPKDLQVQ